MALLGHARTQYESAVKSLLYYLYSHCLETLYCDYDFDTDGDGLSDRAEDELGSNPVDPGDGLVAPTLKVTHNGNGNVRIEVSTTGHVSEYQLFEEHDPEAYKLGQQFSADKGAQDNLTTLYKQFGNGLYHFKAKACIEVSTEYNGTRLQCSNDYSNQVQLKIESSAIESPISVVLPNTQASQHTLSHSALSNHAELQPTTGHFRVTESGAAAYSIPIALPAGITGVQPEVSLNYHSQSPDSTVALGWSLAAGSSISRCRQTKAQDGQFKGLTLTDEDRYCLNGQRLISTEGSAGSSVDGATIEQEYVTEIDSQVSVLRVSRGGNTWFVVKGKDGSTSQYGETALSRVSITNSEGNESTLSWLISEVQDNKRQDATTIKYHYTDAVGSSALGASERVLSYIEYSGHRVEFNYSVGEIRSTSYVDQAEVQQRARLSEIVVKNHLGDELSTYALSFKTANNGVRLLEQVQQCRNSVCRKPIKFDYDAFATALNFEAESQVMIASSVDWDHEPQKMAAVTLADLQGDGKPELVTLVRVDQGRKFYRLCVYQGNTYQRPEELSCKLIGRGDDHESVVLFAMDPDQDGKHALVVNLRAEHSDNAHDQYWEMYSLDGSGALRSHALPKGWDPKQYMREIKPADMNGDGYADLFFKQKKDDANLYVKIWQPSDNSYADSIRLTTTNSEVGFDSRGSFTQKGTDWQVMDLNFDGLADIVSLRCDNHQKCDDYEAKRISVHYNQGGDKDGTFNRFSGLNIAYEGKIEQLTPADVNGDGLVDIIYLGSDFINNDIKRWKVLLNKSSSETAFRQAMYLTAYSDTHRSGTVSEHIPPMLSDLDKDGKVELYFKNGSGSAWTQYEWSPEQQTFEEVTHSAFNAPINHENGHYAFFADYNNDGVSDMLIKDEWGITVKYNIAQSPTEGLLTGITQGFGINTTVHYGLMTDPEVYSDLDEELATDTAQFAQDGLKVRKVIGPSTLVRRVLTDSPSTDSAITRSKVEYHYQGARVQFGGRGMLGFKALTTKVLKKGTGDAQGTVFTTTTRYHQAFPLTGMPYSTEKRMGEGTLLSIAKNGYEKVSTTQQGGALSYQVYNSRSRECSAVVDSDFTIGLHTCTDTRTVQDSYANVTELDTATYQVDVGGVSAFIDGGAAGENGNLAALAKTVLTENTYGSSPVEKKYGRLTNTKVTTSVPASDTGSNIVRSSDFTYYPGGHAHSYMLQKEIVGLGLGCNMELTTEYSYDHLGNKTQTATSNSGCPEGEQETRFTKYIFDNEGRYINYTEQWSSDNTGLVMTSPKVLSRNAFGSAVKVQDVHDVETDTQYDQFGGKVGQYTSTGAQSYKYMTYCSDGADCGAQLNTEVNGELVAVEFIDKMGRPYHSSKVDATGQWLISTAKFDEYGRNITVKSAGSDAVSSKYDVLDRVTSVDDPNTNTLTTHTVTGLVSSTTISGSDMVDQVKTSTTNILGQVVSSSQNRGAAVNFTYYDDGSKKDTRSDAEAVGKQLLMSLSYDALGRKLTQTDADRGDWSYTYNAFGELVTQTDPRGVVLTMSYDGFGRKIKQTQTTPEGEVINEGSSEWHYGTSTEDVHLLLSANQSDDWQQNYYYDTFGRTAAVLTSLDGVSHCASKVAFNTASNDLQILDPALKDPLTSKCVIQQTAYDEYSRVALQFDDYRRLHRGSQEYIEARGVAFEYAYNQVRAKTEAREGSQGQNYYRILDTNERGQVISYQKGNVTMSVGYDAKGMLSSIVSTSHAAIQSDSYQFDSIGNLVSRAQLGMEKRDYHYDDLNRVLGVNGVDLFAYSASGNLETKAEYRVHDTPKCDGSNVEIIAKWTQNYGEDAKPLHAITSRTKEVGNACAQSSAAMSTVNSETFSYDANGNETSVKEGSVSIRSIKYSARNKAVEIQSKGELVTFSYDVNNRRFKRSEANQTIYYVGALQLTIPRSAEQESFINRYIGNDAQQTYYGTGQSRTKWMFTDHQGSTIAITNSEYKLLKRFAYDIFGKQIEVKLDESDVQAHFALEAKLPIFDSVSSNFKAYTGHEPVSLGGENRIIHMNGRIYDADTGRFMQADPFVQAPNNLQNYNAYTYVLNNPLSYTDPSGYLFKKLLKGIKKYWKVAVAAVASYYTFGAASGWASAWAAGTGGFSATAAAAIGYTAGGAAAGLVGGAITSGSLKGALRGALSGAIMGGIGGSLSGVEAFVASGLAGGIITDLEGGKFSSGFFSAGIGAAMGGRFGKNPYTQVIGSAVVGGTISKLTGGKFSNGAISAAFAAAMRADWKSDPIPENSNVAFVGGATDDTNPFNKVVRSAYDEHIDKYGKDSAVYFENTQHKELALWIDQRNGNGTVIAHSYGADMAAQVIADGHSVARLVTVDPVGWSKPNFSKVAANSGVWQNYDAGDSLKSFNNVVATVGGAWNSAPANYATSHQRYKQLDHVQICQVFCKY